MRTVKWTQRSFRIKSVLGGHRSGRIAIGSSEKHEIEVENLSGTEVIAEIGVACPGPYLRAAKATGWSDGRRELAPGKAGTFRGELEGCPNPAGPSLPASENAVVSVSAARMLHPNNMRVYAKRPHPINVV